MSPTSSSTNRYELSAGHEQNVLLPEVENRSSSFVALQNRVLQRYACNGGSSRAARIVYAACAKRRAAGVGAGEPGSART